MFDRRRLVGLASPVTARQCEIGAGHERSATAKKCEKKGKATDIEPQSSEGFATPSHALEPVFAHASRLAGQRYQYIRHPDILIAQEKRCQEPFPDKISAVE